MTGKKINKRTVWLIIGLVLIVVIGYGAYWGYGKYQANQRAMAVENRIKEYEEQFASHSEDVDFLMEYAIFLHDYDNLARLEKAMELFELIQELSPDNPTAIGYYGSAMTKIANHVESIPEKVENLQAGLDIMDKNVSDHPDSFDARMVRAENNYYIPEMFNRINVSIKDYEYMLQMTESGQYASMIPYLKLRLGQSYIKGERPEDARKVLQELVAEYPEHYYAKQAEEILKSID